MAPPPDRYPRQVMGVALLGTYLIAVNTSALGIALPAIAEDLNITGGGADWIITAYLAALAISMPATSWLADNLGRRRAYVGTLGLFAAGVLISTLAPNLMVLLVGRVLQGLGGGPLMPLGMAMIYELHPPGKRGSVMGLYGIGVAAAPAVGPPLGGWLVTAGSWRLLFALLFLGAIIGLVAAHVTLRELVPLRPSRFDLRGWLALSLGLTTLAVAAREANAWGYLSVPSLTLFGFSVTAMWLFARWSRRARDPILDVRVFRSPAFSLTMALMTALAVCQYTRLNFLPVELQIVRGMSALEVGVLLVPNAIAIAFAMPVGGRLADRVGPRPPVVAGLALLATSTWALATLTPSTAIVTLVGILLLQGLGSGLIFAPAQVTALNATGAALMPQASTMTQLNRQVSAALGTAVMGAILTTRLGTVTPIVRSASDRATTQAGFNTIFAVAAVVATLGTVLALKLPAKAALASVREEREREYKDLVSRISQTEH